MLSPLNETKAFLEVEIPKKETFVPFVSFVSFVDFVFTAWGQKLSRPSATITARPPTWTLVIAPLASFVIAM